MSDDAGRLTPPFRLRAPRTPSAPGWPPDVAPNQIIFAGHINAIRDSVADWPGDVNGHGHKLSNVVLEAVTGVMVDPMTTPGDLIARGAAATARLGIGANAQVLTVDTSLPGKLKWAAAVGAVVTVFGRAGVVVAASGDYTAAQVLGAVDQAGAYANPSWITALAWAKITGAPATGVSSVFGRAGVVVAGLGDYTAAQVTNAVDSSLVYANPAWLGSLAYNKLTGVPAAFPPAAHVHDAGDVVGGVFPPARLGTGVSDATVYLRGDGTWAAVAGAGGGSVTSVFGRAGTVIAQTGDYSVAQVTGALANPTTAKGDVLVRDAAAVVRVPVGADGQVLQADSTQSTGVKWAPVSGSWVDPTTAKGDLLVRDNTAITRLALGTDAYVLTADSATATGVKWAPAAGGAGAVTSVFTRTGAVVAASGDYTAAQVLGAVDSGGAYANPAWITSLSFTKLTGVPAFVTDPTTTKGDLLARSASALSRLPAGADGFVLTADAAQLSGVKWAPASVGSPQTPWAQDINAAGFRLLNTGNVGIGTASPTSPAHVNALAVAPSLSTDAIAPNLRLQCSGTYLDVGRYNSSPFAHWVQVYGGGSAFPLALQPLGGNVGIGTAAPYEVLSVIAPNRSGFANANQFAIGEGSNNPGYRLQLGFSLTDQWTSTVQSMAGGAGGLLFLNPLGGNVGVGVNSNSIPFNLMVRAGGDGNLGISPSALGGNAVALFSINNANSINQAFEIRATNTFFTVGPVFTQARLLARSHAVNSDYQSGAIEIRQTNETQGVGGDNRYAPRIGFHWTGIGASQIGMDSAGVIRTFDNPGTGYADFKAENITANGVFYGNGSGLTNLPSTGGGVTVQSQPGKGLGIVYQNTTGKPLMVTVKVNMSTGYAEAYCDTANPPTTSVATAGSNGTGSTSNSLTFWVLPNYYYKVSSIVGATLNGWTEWY